MDVHTQRWTHLTCGAECGDGQSISGGSAVLLLLLLLLQCQLSSRGGGERGRTEGGRILMVRVSG